MKSQSIFSGFGELVYQWLSIPPKGSEPHYRHRAAALHLSKPTASIPESTNFLESAYALIRENCLAARAGGYKNASRENWRWKRHTEISGANESPEVRLERSMVRVGGEAWSNQVPVASGLINATADKRAAIDLVHKISEDNFEFIELKVESENPLFAAIEILSYGLVFVWSQQELTDLGYDVAQQPILGARAIDLCVLAPYEYYEGLDLSRLAESLTVGLELFGASRDLKIGFEFRRFSYVHGQDNAVAAINRSERSWGE